MHGLPYDGQTIDLLGKSPPLLAGALGMEHTNELNDKVDVDFPKLVNWLEDLQYTPDNRPWSEKVNLTLLVLLAQSGRVQEVIFARDRPVLEACPAVTQRNLPEIISLWHIVDILGWRGTVRPLPLLDVFHTWSLMHLYDACVIEQQVEPTTRVYFSAHPAVKPRLHPFTGPQRDYGDLPIVRTDGDPVPSAPLSPTATDDLEMAPVADDASTLASDTESMARNLEESISRVEEMIDRNNTSRRALGLEPSRFDIRPDRPQPSNHLSASDYTDLSTQLRGLSVRNSRSRSPSSGSDTPRRRPARSKPRPTGSIRPMLEHAREAVAKSHDKCLRPGAAAETETTIIGGSTSPEWASSQEEPSLEDGEHSPELTKEQLGNHIVYRERPPLISIVEADSTSKGNRDGVPQRCESRRGSRSPPR
ncbi:hypothetical protein BJX64DRAFT_294770 [Aspergillus heterothallicus]